MGTVITLKRALPDAVILPAIDLESVRDYVNRLPVYRLEAVARESWHTAKLETGDKAVRLFYIVAFIASRIADECLWERIPPSIG